MKDLKGLKIIFNSQVNPQIKGLPDNYQICLYILKENKYRAIIIKKNFEKEKGENIDLSEVGAIMIAIEKGKEVTIEKITKGKIFAQGGLMANAGEKTININQDGTTYFENGPVGKVSMFSNSIFAFAKQ